MSDLIIPIEVTRSMKRKSMRLPIFLLAVLCGGLVFSLVRLPGVIAVLAVIVIGLGIWLIWRWLQSIRSIPMEQRLTISRNGKDLLISASAEKDSVRTDLTEFRQAWVHQDEYKDAGVTDSAIYLSRGEDDARIQTLNVGAWNVHPDVYKVAFIHHQLLFFIADHFPHIEILTNGGKETLSEAWEAWNQPRRGRAPAVPRGMGHSDL